MSTGTTITPVRVGVYVDGFNLYFGMRAAKLRRYYWLDLHALAQRFLKDGQMLAVLKYFTAHVKGNPEKSRRQLAFLETIKDDHRVQVVIGNYQIEEHRCHNCSSTLRIPKEKQTDTNIATEMVVDAFTNQWDRAILVSGDADLVPPIQAIRNRLPSKSVIVAFPPNRALKELRQAATDHFHIENRMLEDCQMDDKVTLSNGIVQKRPEYWK
jgi:uncharacterized LabA/DUF88 family protein